jgi:Spy/CpxP family protein refolding chaperone
VTQNTWKAVGMLLLAALVGGAIGTAATVGVRERRHEQSRRGGSGWYVEMLTRELSLTEAQRDSVQQVLTRHRAGMDSIWAEMAPRMRAWREGVRADVRSYLTPEQQTRYAELTARLDAEREGRQKADSTR